MLGIVGQIEQLAISTKEKDHEKGVLAECLATLKRRV